MLHQTYDYLVEQLLAECRKYYSSRLISFCLFGSAARSTVGPHSDVDFLLVVEPLPDGRAKRVEEFMPIERALQGTLTAARQKGIFIELSPVLKTPEEVRIGSPLFLDMVEGGKLLFDTNGFFKNFLEGLRARLRAQGAHRVYRGDSWHWLLKTPYVPGDVGHFLVDNTSRFDTEVQAGIPPLAEISSWLRKEREFSFYEDIDFIPTERYTRRWRAK